MDKCETSTGKHRHHIGVSKPNGGILSMFRSMVLSPQVIVGVPLSPDDYINLPFQPEQRLTPILDYETQIPASKSTGCSKRHRRGSSSTSSTCYTVQSRRAQPSEKKPTARRHSATTTLVLSSMRHANILYVTDLPLSTLGIDLQITPIHLGTVIYQAGKLSSREADCYITQLLSGLAYLHFINITHRDICPRNLLLTPTGVLKISNYTSSEHVKSANNHRSSKRCGTMAYIAPEVFLEKNFDGKAVDMWAVGMVYMEMRSGKVLWEMAAEGADEDYDGYLRDRVGLWGYRPVENLKNKHCRSVVRSLLDPFPGTRMTASGVLQSKWGLETELCAAAATGEGIEKS